MRRLVIALPPLLAVGALLLAQPPAPPRKVALLVGVGAYKHNWPPLGKTPANDSAEMAKVLRAGGYEVAVLTDADATKAAVEAAFRRALDGKKADADPVNRLGQGDALLVHLCGHGVQTKGAGADPADGEQPFFCPHDAVPNKPDTHVRLNSLIGDAADQGVRAMFLIDACRDNPDPRLRGRSGIQGTKAVMPDGVTVLFSCGRGQTAQQDDKLGHGLFTYAVLRTLRGETGLAGKSVSWAALVSDVEEQFGESGPVKTALGTHTQSPVEAKGEAGRTLLLAVAPAAKKPADGQMEQKPPPADTAEAITSAATGMKLVRVKAGTFTMGSPDGEEGRSEDEVRHPVTLSKDFYLGVHEVTRGQFRKFVDDSGYKTEAESDGEGGYGFDAATGKLEGRKPKYTWRSTGFAQTDAHPVVNVTWNDAVKFCAWISGKDERAYRLPTEAEWEYSSRTGGTSKYHFGDDAEDVAKYGNISDATAKAQFPDWTDCIKASDGYAFTAPVGSFRPNAWGLYDMHGNAWEWCSDWYGDYPTSRVTDPCGPERGSVRVFRGGSWFNSARGCRSADRGRSGPEFRNGHLGFRVAAGPAGP